MTAPVPNYAHSATFLSGHDGDSFWLSVDFGMNTHGVRLILPCYLRLANIDTWELTQKLGPEARDFTNAQLASRPIVVQTIKPSGASVGEEKYGRFLARVFVGDDDIADLLRAKGYEKVKTPA